MQSCSRQSASPQAWFLDRFQADVQRLEASEALARDIVDPFLAEQGVIRATGQALTSHEARAALLLLGLQWEDDTREKGLTKLSFDALVRSVLRNTDGDHRLSREGIHQRIQAILASHDTERVRELTDSALARLTKKKIRHWSAVDEFCLTHQERLRIQERSTVTASLDHQVNAELRRSLRYRSTDLGVDEDSIELIVDASRQALEEFFLSRGEIFATALLSERLPSFERDDLKTTAIRVVGRCSLPSTVRGHEVVMVSEAVVEVLTEPSEAVHQRLRNLADAYTLLAFLRQTPDVQLAVSKMFAHGRIWLDTTVVLPLLAEELLTPSEQRFTRMIRAATEAGLELRVISGVLEEIERHMNRSLAFTRIGSDHWYGDTPFLAGMYIGTGRSAGTFGSWLEHFRGEARPLDDVAEYLEERLALQVESLTDYAEAAPPELRIAVQEIWHEAHERRRLAKGDVNWDEVAVQQLVRHDVENYVGVVQRRIREDRSPLGYSTWWLTLDRIAYQVQGKLRSRLSAAPPASPVMSADFLVNYLALGPSRRRVSKSTEAQLPFLVDAGLVQHYTPDLLAEAARIRQEAAGLEEHIIRRRVRDHLDKAKRRLGAMALGGLDSVRDQIGTQHSR